MEDLFNEDYTPADLVAALEDKDFFEGAIRAALFIGIDNGSAKMATEAFFHFLRDRKNENRV